MLQIPPSLSVPFQILFTLILGAASAAAQSGDTTPPIVLTQPVFTPTTNPQCPLVARLQFTTDEPAATDIALFGPGGSLQRLTAEPEFNTTHDVIVAGMRPNTAYDVRFMVRDVAGNRSIWPTAFHIVTPSLPPAFPRLHATTSFPTRMEPGITLFCTFFSSPTLSGAGAYVIGVDAQGEVIWFYYTRDHLINVERLHNGNLLLLDSPFQAQEIDLAGHLVNRWWARGGGLANMPPGSIFVDVDQFHHEFHEIQNDPAADFIFLTTEIRQYPNYPASEIDPTITNPISNVAGEVVVEIRRDGTVVRRTKLLDILDPYRVCYGSLAGYYDAVYGSTLDWAHANSVIIDPSDDTYVVSLRTQDCVVKIDRTTGQLVWIHGDPGRWNPPWSAKLLTPIGANFGWQNHQHGPHIDANGTLTLFDNGNYRVIPPLAFGPTSAFYSRGVKFHIDPIAMTTEVVYDYRGGAQPFFSGFLGDCDPLPLSGNVLICDGAKQVPMMNKTYARLVEVTGKAPLGKVFELIVNDPTLPTDPFNWNIYRSQRWPDIYSRP